MFYIIINIFSLFSLYYYYYSYRNSKNEIIEIVKPIEIYLDDFITTESHIRTKDQTKMLLNNIIPLFHNNLPQLPDKFYNKLITMKYTESLYAFQKVIKIILSEYYDFKFFKNIVSIQLHLPEYLKHFEGDKIETAENIYFQLISESLFDITVPTIKDENENNNLISELLKDYNSKQWRYQLNILASLYSLLLTGNLPSKMTNEITLVIKNGIVASDNPNIQFISFILSGFIAHYYPSLFNKELIEIYKDENMINIIFESIIPLMNESFDKPNDIAKYFNGLNLNETVVSLMTYITTVDNFDFMNRKFSLYLTICNTIRRLCRVLKNDLIKSVYEGMKLFTKSVDLKRCRILSGVVKGVFNYIIKDDDKNEININDFCNLYNLLSDNIGGSNELISKIFKYEGRIKNGNEMKLIPIISNINEMINGIKDRSNNLTKICSYVKSLNELLYLLFPFYKDSNKDIIAIGKNILILLKDLLNSDYIILLEPSVKLYMCFYHSKFNKRDEKENELSEGLKNINEDIKSRLNIYIQKYINENSFETSKEGKEYLIYLQIISQFYSNLSYYKQLNYVNQLIVPLIRSSMDNQQFDESLLSRNEIYFSRITENEISDDFWNEFNLLLLNKSPMVRKMGYGKVGSFSMCNCDLLHNIDIQDKLYKLIYKGMFDDDVDVRNSCYNSLIFILSNYNDEKLLKKVKNYEANYNKAISLV